MNSKPILFTGPMVRAILDGRKTQTRRAVKPQPQHMPILCSAGLTVGADFLKDGSEWVDADCINAGVPMINPYGTIGDTLWVKETFLNNAIAGYPPVYFYRADSDDKPHDKKWKSPIFMPRKFSRITLEIVSVRVERLNAISADDAIAEGIERLSVSDRYDLRGQKVGRKNHYKFYGKELERLKQQTSNPVWSYETLWEKINGKGSWKLNPWVWVIEFRRVSQPAKGGV